jgi:SNF2 family DNA or RNA helicase
MKPELFFDQQRNMLVYNLDDPARLLPYVEGGLSLSNGYVACPPTLYNLQVAKAVQLPTLEPMRDYDWPIRAPWRVRDHQRAMANFMTLHPRAFNLSDMGSMKTLATLWAADFIMQQNPGWRCLIVCPLSIMQRVWGDAITTHFLGRRTYTVIHGDADKRRKLLAERSDFYIINFDGVGVGAKVNKSGGIQLEGLSHELAARQDIAIVAIDEGRAYSAHTTRRSRVARAVLVPKPYVWLLSGTPTPNGPLDAYGLCRIVNPGYPESFTSFKNRVMYRLGPWKWVPRPGAHSEAYKLLQPSIRFEMRECVDVPPCTEQMRDVELSAEQRDHYRKLKRDCVLQLGDRIITAVHEAALRLKLIQISCGAVYDEHHNISYIDCEPRLNELRDVIEEAHRKIIVFAPLTSVIHMLHTTLSKNYSCEIINGSIPTKQRDTIFKNFQGAENPQILIADPASMSHGLDLHAASVICWYGATDRTELYLQGNRRIDRPGQTVPTTIVQLAATRIEREIYRRAAANQSMQGLILQLVKGID